MDRSTLGKVLARFAGALAVAAFTGALVAQTAAKPDLAKAEQIATQVCASCHGVDGNSAAAPNPHLAGQPAEYITRQLRHFKDGIRKNDIMQAMAAPLSEEDVRALGLYFSRQKLKPGSARDAELVMLGQKLYRGGDVARALPACSGCHAPTGVGIPVNYPRLAGQFADYTYSQLKAFKEERRGADPGGKDGNGRIMAQIADKMSDRDMRAVAEYLSGLM
jgi:cytochrome c553